MIKRIYDSRNANLIGLEAPVNTPRGLKFYGGLRSRLKELGISLPRGGFRLRLRLDPIGRYLIIGRADINQILVKNQAVVVLPTSWICFLPSVWTGKRISFSVGKIDRRAK